MNIAELGAKYKVKNPQYVGKSDEAVGSAILKKYPQYQSQVTIEPVNPNFIGAKVPSDIPEYTKILNRFGGNREVANYLYKPPIQQPVIDISKFTPSQKRDYEILTSRLYNKSPEEAAKLAVTPSGLEKMLTNMGTSFEQARQGRGELVSAIKGRDLTGGLNRGLNEPPSAEERIIRGVTGLKNMLIGSTGTVFAPPMAIAEGVPGGEVAIEKIGNVMTYTSENMPVVGYNSVIERMDIDPNSEQGRTLKELYDFLPQTLLLKYAETRGKISNWKGGELSPIDKIMEYPVRGGEKIGGLAKNQFLRKVKKLTNDIKEGKVTEGPLGLQSGDVIINTSKQNVVNNRVKELVNIEDNYAGLRKAKEYSKDSLSGSRNRVANVDIWQNAVDENGLIRTKQEGGAVDQYKTMTVEGKEAVVRKNLDRLGESINLNTIEKELLRTINESGIEGEALIRARRAVSREIEGYRLRADINGNVPLTLLHDAKVSKGKEINWQTPATEAMYKKAIVRGLKETIEKTSRFNVKDVNAEIAKYLQDVKYLESLDGRRVKGGKMSKYFAQISGNIAGGLFGGIIGGMPGSAVGTIIGGELAGRIRGSALSRTLEGKTGGLVPKSEILEQATKTGNMPRAMLSAPQPGAFKTQVESGPIINLPSKSQSTLDLIQSNNLGNRNAMYKNPNIPSMIPISPTLQQILKKVKGKNFKSAQINLMDIIS